MGQQDFEEERAYVPKEAEGEAFVSANNCYCPPKTDCGSSTMGVRLTCFITSMDILPSKRFEDRLFESSRPLTSLAGRRNTS